MIACRAAVRLPKAFEDMRQKICTDSLAVVSNPKMNVGIILENQDTNLTARRREFDCIRQQIPNDLLQTVRVTRNQYRLIRSLNPDLNVFRFRGWPHHVDSGLDDPIQIRRLQIEIEISSHDARDIQDVVDNLGLRFGVALNGLNRPASLGRSQISGVEQ